jgi:hypothetical protein
LRRLQGNNQLELGKKATTMEALHFLMMMMMAQVLDMLLTQMMKTKTKTKMTRMMNNKMKKIKINLIMMSKT